MNKFNLVVMVGLAFTSSLSFAIGYDGRVTNDVTCEQLMPGRGCFVKPVYYFQQKTVQNGASANLILDLPKGSKSIPYATLMGYITLAVREPV